ncbi:hypothetical protein [Rhodococcus pyridinivorans]|uniref:hypothetical protein n=1 Tax=Rhodococcus pyridinivorans TaxID=103816 RepID=UPI00128FC60D|nr:hypothetical protein [Rhodococcus pyridinivorans]
MNTSTKVRATVAAILTASAITLGSGVASAAPAFEPTPPVAVQPVFLGVGNPSCGPLISLPLIGPILHILCRV